MKVPRWGTHQKKLEIELILTKFERGSCGRSSDHKDMQDGGVAPTLSGACISRQKSLLDIVKTDVTRCHVISEDNKYDALTE